MRTLSMLFFASLTMVAVAQQPVSVYDFNNSLAPVVNKTGFATDLDYRTGNGSSISLGTPTYIVDDVNGNIKPVAAFMAPDFFRANHGMLANGGGAYVNLYTMVMDIKITSIGNWVSFFNTNEDVQNDGDAFIRTDDLVGISGNYAGFYPREVWNRVAISVDCVNQFITIYVNGVQQNQVGISGLDGRWAAYCFDDPFTGIDNIDIFGDEDGDNGSGYISGVAFYDSVLTPGQIAKLGRAGNAFGPSTKPIGSKIR